MTLDLVTIINGVAVVVVAAAIIGDTCLYSPPPGPPVTP